MGPNRLLQHIRTVHQNSVYHCATAAQVRQLPATSPAIPQTSFDRLPTRLWILFPSQEVVAQGFQREFEHYGKPDSYFVQLPKEMQQKRDRLVQSLVAVGMKPIVPEGTYFLVADISEFSELCSGRVAQAGPSLGISSAWSHQQGQEPAQTTSNEGRDRTALPS